MKCRFLKRGENQSTQGKIAQNREENQQTQPKYHAESGNRTWATLVGGECSHHYHTTALPALPALVFGLKPIKHTLEVSLRNGAQRIASHSKLLVW